jgi:hypothetical protein
MSIHVGAKLIIEQCLKTREEIEDMVHVPYACVIGSLMYTMVFPRPDICHVVGMLSIYMSTPRKEHRTTVKRVFRYLSGTKTYAISYQRKPKVDR